MHLEIQNCPGHLQIHFDKSWACQGKTKDRSINVMVAQKMILFIKAVSGWKGVGLNAKEAWKKTYVK